MVVFIMLQKLGCQLTSESVDEILVKCTVTIQMKAIE